MTTYVTRLSTGKLFYEDWALGYDQWTKNVINTITDSIQSGEEEVTDASRSDGADWIYNHTDTGSQHHATSITSIPGNCILEAEVKITSDEEDQMGQVGVGFVKNSNKTLHAWIGVLDGYGATIEAVIRAMWDSDAHSQSGSPDTYYRLKIRKTDTTYDFYYNETSLGSSGVDADAVDRLAIAIGAYGTHAFISPSRIVNILFYKSETITMGGALTDGQKFNIRDSEGNILAWSTSASEGFATIDISTLSTRPPYYDIQVTDSGGSYVIYTSTNNLGDVWGGDLYSFVSTPPPPPPGPSTSKLVDQIQIEVNDEYPTGTYDLESQVTIVSKTLGVSAAINVKRIERDMTDPYWARLDLGNRVLESWELDEPFRRRIVDLTRKEE